MNAKPYRRALWILFPALLLIFGTSAAVFGQEPDTTGTKESGEDAKEEKKKDLPLEPERKVEFTTREGTWISLDVSPDGKTIVFELLGDLYTLPIGGGEATRITSGMAFDSQPSYSPDGSRIAFLSDRDGGENVWLANADGTEPKQLSKDKQSEFASPTWMPDGDYVLVSRTRWGLNTNELWMYHIHGGSGVQVTKAKSGANTPTSQRHNALGATVSPDGRYIYYARRTGGFAYNATFPLWQIARRDMISGDEDVITGELGSGIRPVLSPNGKMLVYGTRYETGTALRIRNLSTGEDDWLAYPIQRDDQESRFTRDLLPTYAFMPDGKDIVLAFDGGFHRLSIDSGKSREIPFEADVDLDIGPDLHVPRRVEEGAVRARLIQDPVQSPDGKKLVASALTHLYVMDLPDGQPKRLTKEDAREFKPAWSPDGDWIAYVTWSEEAGHIWKIKSNGKGKPKRLTKVPALYTDLAWAPDGERIIALRGNRYMREHAEEEFAGISIPLDLVWIPADGGDATLIAPARGLGKPHFGPEKDRIYVYGGGMFVQGGGQGIVSMRFDGTDRREHVKVTGPGLYFAERPVGANDARISPDGRWVLAFAKNQLYVAAVPQIGGDAPEINVTGAGVPVKKLTDVGADYFEWADGGKTTTWAVGSTFFRQKLDTIDFEEKKDDESKSDDNGGEESNGDDDGDDQNGNDDDESAEPSNVEEIEVDIERPRYKPEGTVVLRGATVITMEGDEVVRNADVVVTDNRIAAVGAQGSVTVPSKAKVVDVSGMHIVPGFIDTHAHWIEVRKGVLDVQNWTFLANVAYGVTTGLDVQTMTNDMFAYQDLVDIGEIIGPRAYSTGPGVFSDNDFSSMEEAKGVLSKYRKYYRTQNLKSYIVGNRKQRQYVVQAAKELGMMPTTEGGLDLKLDLTHAIDGFAGNEHSLPIVPLFKDVVELYAQTHIGYTPTLLVNYGGPFGENYFYTHTEVHDNAKLNRFVPHNVIDARSKRRQWFRDDEYAFPRTAASAAKVLRAGGRVGIGAHGQLQGLGYHWEMWALAMGGLTPMEVLRCATVNGAAMIGFPEDLGSIKAGKLADLVVLDKDPLADIHNTTSVHYVMKNGELFVGDTLEKLWPTEEKLPTMWWQEEGPPE